jgi:hypothetical protein
MRSPDSTTGPAPTSPGDCRATQLYRHIRAQYPPAELPDSAWVWAAGLRVPAGSARDALDAALIELLAEMRDDPGLGCSEEGDTDLGQLRARTHARTRSRLIDAARRHARRGDALPLIGLEEHPPDPNTTATAHDARIALIVTREWLRSGRRRDRHAVLLSLSGYCGSEIAEAIGCSETAARQVVSRALRRLRVELGDTT